MARIKPARQPLSEQHPVMSWVDFTFANTGQVLTIGVLPPGATVYEAGVIVSVAQNAVTTNLLQLGTVADPDGFATDLALGTIGRIVADELATSNDLGPYTVDTTLIASPTQTGTAATAGTARAYVLWFAGTPPGG